MKYDVTVHFDRSSVYLSEQMSDKDFENLIRAYQDGAIWTTANNAVAMSKVTYINWANNQRNF